MTLNKPPAKDAERLANLLQAACGPGDLDDMTEDEIRAEARAGGVDFAAWAAELRAQATAQRAPERRTSETAPPRTAAPPRAALPPPPAPAVRLRAPARAPFAKRAAAGVGVAAAACGMVILVYGQLVSQPPLNSSAPHLKEPLPPMSMTPAEPTQSTDAGAHSAAPGGKMKKKRAP